MTTRLRLILYVFFCIIFQHVAFVSSYIGFSTAGFHFVFSYPKLGSSTPLDGGYLDISTEEEISRVSIYEPLKIRQHSDGWERTASFTLRRFASDAYILDNERLFATNGIYTALKIRATGAIKVTFGYYDEVSHEGDLVSLIPRSSCFSSYQVATYTGYPFIMVVSFDKTTKIKVSFGTIENISLKPIRCGASELCGNEKTVEVMLDPYRAWFFKMDSKKATFQRTSLESDVPFFVLAGNAVCMEEGSWKGKDACFTRPQAVSTWSKTYITPYLHSTQHGWSLKLVFNFDAKIQFLKFYIVDRSQSVMHVTTGMQPFSPYGLSETFIVSSKNFFGLTMSLLQRPHPTVVGSFGLVTLVPCELWMDGFVYFQSELDKELFTTGNTLTEISLWILATGNAEKSVVLPDSKQRLFWAVGDYTNIKISYTRVNAMKSPTRIMSRAATTRLMVYIVYSVENHTTTMTRAIDFFNNKIYSTNCERTWSIENDGIDNDCDGYIDEEEKNNIDDDKDGKVDEDCFDVYKDGEWTSWRPVCTVSCGNSVLKQSARFCLRSRLGSLCEGSNTKCGDGDACPEECGGGVLPVRNCTCLKSCAECTPSGCEFCKPNYYSSEFCLQECPDGMSGVGCSVRDERTFVQTMEYIAFIFITFAVVMVTGVLLATAFYLFKKRKRKIVVNELESAGSILSSAKPPEETTVEPVVEETLDKKTEEEKTKDDVEEDLDISEIDQVMLNVVKEYAEKHGIQLLPGDGDVDGVHDDDGQEDAEHEDAEHEDGSQEEDDDDDDEDDDE